MDGTIRKMERFASSTAALCTELEALTKLELSAKKFPPLMLVRAVCTIHQRICQVFGDSILGLEKISASESPQLSGQIVVFRHVPLNFGLLRSDAGDNRLRKIKKSVAMVEPGVHHHCDGLRFNCRANPERLFMECISLSSPASWKGSDEHFEEHRCVRQSRSGSLVPFSGEQGSIKERIGRLRLSPSNRRRGKR